MRRFRVPPFVSVIGNQGFISAANLVVSIFLLRVIGVESFGVYAVCFAIAYGISAISNALVSMPLVSTASRKSESVRQSMILSSGLALGLMFTGVFALGLISELVLRLGCGVAYPITLVAFFGVSLGAVEFGRRKSFLVGDRAGAWKIDLGRFFLLLCSFFFVSQSQWRLDPFAYALCFAVSNFLAVSVFAAPEFLNRGAFAGRRKLLKEVGYVMKHGQWLSLSTSLQLLSDQAILLLVAGLAGNFAAGVVRTCQMIVGVINPILMSLENILPRRLGGLMRRMGEANALRAFATEAALLLLGLCAVLGLLFLFSPQVISLVTQGELDGYGMLLRLYCIVWALYALKSILSVVLRSRLQMKGILAADAIATVAIVPIAIALILRYDAYGAAIGTVLSQLCVVLLLGYRVVRKPEGTP